MNGVMAGQTNSWWWSWPLRPLMSNPMFFLVWSHLSIQIYSWLLLRRRRRMSRENEWIPKASKHTYYYIAQWRGPSKTTERTIQEWLAGANNVLIHYFMDGPLLTRNIHELSFAFWRSIQIYYIMICAGTETDAMGQLTCCAAAACTSIWLCLIRA